MRGLRAVPRLSIVYPGICLTTEGNTENISQCRRKPLGLSAPTAILLVDLSFASDGHERLACPCHPWLSRQAVGSTLSQRKYLPSCRTTVFPKSANFELKLGVTALMLSASSGTLRCSCMCLLRTYEGAPVAKRRHLDCNNCSFRTLVRTAYLHAGELG